MQKKILIALLFLNFGKPVFAQDTTMASPEPVFDSATVLSNLLALLDSTSAPQSYGLVSIGIGNRLFSVRNNRLNARQPATQRLLFNPMVGYFHKSGFSIAAGSSLLQNPTKGFGPTQFSITPAWDLTSNNTWGVGISYSRYIATDKYSIYASPIQNDVFAYASYKKSWIEPGIALGYSTGKYREINSFTLLATGNTYTDTGTFNLQAFSLTAMAGHDFVWDNVFGKNDALSFAPSIMMNFGSDSTETVSHTLFPNLLRFLKRKKRLPQLSGKNAFNAQSVAISLDLSYSFGSFTILPQLYLDYFIPETDENRFSQTFTLAVGYSF